MVKYLDILLHHLCGGYVSMKLDSLYDTTRTEFVRLHVHASAWLCVRLNHDRYFVIVC